LFVKRDSEDYKSILTRWWYLEELVLLVLGVSLFLVQCIYQLAKMLVLN